ncbi:MAG: fructose-1,6-bisphosphatase [Atopobiaceae bacterium]|jgi:fructose-1,6-bisphosphatase-3|nr:fructose-1,6-bisphosphatase [Atopobiaceae bacterium]MCH4180649.1 fructose-1,6-bisphosphatase [Atopobiaceae bacterium]MCH4215081.1 fructose-1,6-bisphosphatase [Atopobiaceae bacterium]MCH4230313.1 fructose-1,6-bisphosphatase [Atopobiaceae bacterium]MCI1227155.1 fructose-1,6-bisphosphatase [Atopobiaceae bacterium]
MSLNTPNSQELKYLSLLSAQFPTCQAAYTEIINLEAILNLPKGTEHFMSDVHGEYEAFEHILNNCSGVIRERVAATFRHELTTTEQADLCTLIYYPNERLRQVRASGQDTPAWYSQTLLQLIRLARFLSESYTRSKVRKAMPVAYAYIIDELLHASDGAASDRHAYHVSIIDSIIETGSAGDFICSIASLIKRLAVDHLHIVGDIFDRGPHADRIIDRLMGYHSLDIQWGNHDVCWMGAAAGSAACVAAVVRNNVHYRTLEVLESAYGISLRQLAVFAGATYKADDGMNPCEKAISVILFKLEGQLVKRHPEFDMDDRLLLDHVDPDLGVVKIAGVDHALATCDFPTLDPTRPYELSPEEKVVLDGLVTSFRESERLHAHIDFLYEHGSIYLVHNGNLLFHGCVPLTDHGSFRSVSCSGQRYAGRSYLDFADRVCRRAWQGSDPDALDWMWYLWCGRYSPLCGRVVKTFERTYLTDEKTWVEAEDPYYQLLESPGTCERILAEFGLAGPACHIVNGHMPVRAAQGESPIKADGRLIVIDGGFCKAYHKTTGIAGYTLIADPTGMRIKAHRPFESVRAALESNADIVSESDQFETYERPLTIADTDTGDAINAQIADLQTLLGAYRSGELTEHAEA